MTALVKATKKLIDICNAMERKMVNFFMVDLRGKKRMNEKELTQSIHFMIIMRWNWNKSHLRSKFHILDQKRIFQVRVQVKNKKR